MKKIALYFLVTFWVGFNQVYGQTSISPPRLTSWAKVIQQDFKMVLKQTFNDFDSSTNLKQKVVLSNRLSMIATKWNNEWLAHYYLGYSKVILSEDKNLSDDMRDAYLDEADQELTQTVTLLGKDNDETHVLAAFIANWRIDISPMTRYMKYGKTFSDHMKQAKAINPDNPRIYYLEGMAWYGMPSFAGGGKEVALPYLTKAAALYEKENDSDIAKPYWGKKLNADYLSQCKIEAANKSMGFQRLIFNMKIRNDQWRIDPV
jgi:hypothetical protein